MLKSSESFRQRSQSPPSIVQAVCQLWVLNLYDTYKASWSQDSQGTNLLSIFYMHQANIKLHNQFMGQTINLYISINTVGR